MGGFFKSGITLNSANRQVKKLNKELTFDEKSINRQYAVIERNFTKEEFELMLLKELQDLALNIITENSGITESELVEKLANIISETEKKPKQIKFE